MQMRAKHTKCKYVFRGKLKSRAIDQKQKYFSVVGKTKIYFKRTENDIYIPACTLRKYIKQIIC